MSVCFICLQPCIVPISLEIFQCFKNYGVHCHSKNHLCFQCYFESLEKGFLKEKCSFCKSALANSINSFRIDYESIDKDEIVQCFICKQEMRHTELITHLFENTTCLYFCQCQNFITKKDLKNHQISCNFWKKCQVCMDYHEKQSDGNFVCSRSGIHCMDCSEIIVNKDHWKNQCLFRTMKCPECSIEIPAIEIVNHYSEHLCELKKDIKCLTNFFYEKKRLYRKKINIFCELYQTVFPNQDIEEQNFPHEENLS